MNSFKKFTLISAILATIFCITALISISVMLYKTNRIIDKTEILNEKIISYEISDCYNSTYYKIIYDEYKIDISINKYEKFRKQDISFYRVDVNGNILNGVFNVENKKDIEFLKKLISKLN
jgi:hypothetical protein